MTAAVAIAKPDPGELGAPCCATCEFFDNGAMDKTSGISDCLNSRADRFQTHREDSCRRWVVSST